MDESTTILVILSILVLCGLSVMNMNQMSVTENFNSYCQNCGYLSARACGSCPNCVYCINSSGRGECVPGTARGPTFRSNCLGWYYGARYSYWYIPPRRSRVRRRRARIY